MKLFQKIFSAFSLCALISGCSGQPFTTNVPGLVGHHFPFTTNAPGRFYTVSTNLLGLWVTNSDFYLNGFYAPTTNDLDVVGSFMATPFIQQDGDGKIAQHLMEPGEWIIGTNQVLNWAFGNWQYRTQNLHGEPDPYPPLDYTWSGYSEVIEGHEGFTNPPTVTPIFQFITNYSAPGFTHDIPGHISN